MRVFGQQVWVVGSRDITTGTFIRAYGPKDDVTVLIQEREGQPLGAHEGDVFDSEILACRALATRLRKEVGDLLKLARNMEGRAHRISMRAFPLFQPKQR